MKYTIAHLRHSAQKGYLQNGPKVVPNGILERAIHDVTFIAEDLWLHSILPMVDTAGTKD
eukprot:gene2841-13616_t